MKRSKRPTRARPDEPLADWCEVRWEECSGRATDRHHILTRARGGSDDSSNTLDCCSNCHTQSRHSIHQSIARAEAAGFYRRTGVAREL